MTNYAADSNRLAQYVERFFARHEKTEWPTVRRAARSLGWTQARVEEAIDGDPNTRMFTSYYFVNWDVLLGDHFIEAC